MSLNTIILSDIHLTTEEPVNPKDPLWRKFRNKQFFIDETFEVFLQYMEKQVNGEKLELILAGDIFDFDGVSQLPEKHKFRMSWLERYRGLNTEERKSRFKIRRILRDHPIFFKALSKFIKNGNNVVFIIGNHDLELHWDSVKNEVLRFMRLEKSEMQRVRFTNWFYISNSDTLVEHGNQYDSHSNCQNPINPKVYGLKRERIRLPFGCHANRYMMNGMGYFNPHSDRTYIMTFREYMRFLVKHVIRKEPLLMWNWLWGACVTLVMTLKDGIAIEVKDPLLVEDQVEEIAKISNATPRMVRALKEIHAPPSFTDPIGVARELWLDRFFTIVALFFMAFQILNLLNIVWKVSYWWVFLIVLIFLPFFVFYFRSFKSKVIVDVQFYEKAVKMGAKITNTKRVVFGHTHEFVHTNFDGVEYLNSGTWSPAFDDVECTKPSCPKSFVWIKPDSEELKASAKNEKNKENQRVASVYGWNGKEINLLC